MSTIKKLKIILFLLLVLQVYSQNTASQSGVITENASFSHKLSQYYEKLVHDVLAKYYKHKSYLVDAKVYINDNAQIPPGSWGDIQSLPGLPVLPEEFKNAQKNPQMDFRDDGQLIDIEVLIDTGYTERDIDFIRSLTIMAANLNELRGDQLLVHRGIFPKGKYQGTFASLREEPPEKAAMEKSVIPSGKENPYELYITNLGSLIPLIITFIFLVLIVWIITKNISQPKGLKNQNDDKIQNLLNDIKSMKEGPPKAPSGENSTDTPKNDFQKLKNFFINSFIGNIQASISVIKNWIDEKEEEGIENFSKVLAHTEKGLLALVESEFSKELFQKIDSKVKEIPETKQEEVVPILQSFKLDFQKITQLNGKENEYKDLFGFMRQLNEQQVLHLLKDESEGIVGLALAQMDGDKAASVLQKIEKNLRTKVLASMGKIENIPLKIYKQLAERLSAKAIDVVNMRYVAADGVESIVDVLDNLPLEAQNDYLNSIAEVNIHLAEKIRDKFITMPEVPELPDKFLQNIINSLDQETLVLTLAHAEDTLKTKVIKLLPERMQMMVESGIENLGDESSEGEENAQKKFLKSIRKEIKMVGGRPHED